MSAIGIFGGTFDPVHIGHLAIAEEARVALRLEQVVFVPARQQPLKYHKHAASAQHRLEMVRLACASNHAFAVSTIEIERDGPSYTVDTLATFRCQLGSNLFFILGADALLDFPRWHRAADVAKLAQLVVVGRPKTPVDLDVLTQQLPSLANRVHMLAGPQLEISSTALRERAALGRNLRYLIPDDVVAYIRRRSLYREQVSAGVERNTEL